MNNMDNLSADELLKRLKENIGEEVKSEDVPEATEEPETAPEETASEVEAPADTAADETPEEEPEEPENEPAFDEAASGEPVPSETSVPEEDLPASETDQTEEFVKVEKSMISEEDPDAPTMEIPNIEGLEAPDMEAFAAAEKDESEKVLDAVGDDGEKFDPSDIGIVIAVEGMEKAKKRFGAEKVREAMNALNLSDEDIPESDEDDGLPANPSGVFLGDEYEKEEQTPEIYEKYKNEKQRIKLRLLGSAIFALCLLIFENLHLIGVNLPGAFNVKAYPAFHVFISLQLLVLAAALSYKEMIAGARKIARFVFDSDTVALFAVGVTALCDLLIAFFANRGEFRLYNFAAAAVLVFCAAHDYLDIRREIYSFDVVSSKKPKYIAVAEERTKDSDHSLKLGLGFGQVDDEPEKLLNVKKVGFVSGYFERTGKETDANKYTPYFVFGALAVAIIFAIVAGVTTKDASSAFAAANLSALMCMPISLFCTSALPLFMASKQSHDNGSAIIGESAVDEYSGASTVVLEDKDVFPSRSVKVKSLKMYGDAQIDEILCDITGVYSKLGGPLFEVLTKATAEIGMREGAEIVECTDGGVSAKFGDEKTILIGSDEYMKQNDVVPTYDYEDEIQLAGGNVRIMFVAYGGELASKLYIQYAIDPDFDGMLRRVHKNEMNVIIKTMDPNIDNALLVGRTKPANYPAKIERGTAEETGAENVPATDSGVVSRTNIKSLISTVLLCDRLLSVRTAANIVKIMSVAVAFIIMLIFALTGSSMFILSLLVALYHLFWVLPVFAVSKLCLK